MDHFVVFQELNVADRLGKFTMVQWAFLASGIVMAMFLLIMGFLPIIPTILLGLVFVLIGAFLAFYERHGLPVYQFLFVYLTYKTQPKEAIYGTNGMDEEFDDFEDDIDFEIF